MRNSEQEHFFFILLKKTSPGFTTEAGVKGVPAEGRQLKGWARAGGGVESRAGLVLRQGDGVRGLKSPVFLK